MSEPQIASIKRRRTFPWLALSVVCGTVAGVLVAALLHRLFWSADFAFGDFASVYLKMTANGFNPILFPTQGPQAREALSAFPWWMGTFHTLIVAGWIGVGWLARGMLAPRDDTRFIRGNVLHEYGGNEAFARATAPKGKDKDADNGVEFIPGHPFDNVIWMSHTSIFAGTGWGKTVAMNGWLNQIAKRKQDKLLLIDVKSDYITIFKQFYILDPLDSRTLYLDIAADLQTEPEAESFADGIVPNDKGGDAVWTMAARLVVAGMAIKLIATNPMRWTWGALYRELIRDADAIRADLKQFAPEKYHALPEAAATQSGVMFNIAGGPLRVISAIAKAYALLEVSSDFESRKFSLRDWATNDDAKFKKIIMRLNGRTKTQSEAFIVAAVGFYAKLIVSPEFKDKPTVRTWLFLDEFAQLPKMPELQAVPAVGRSRKTPMVYGTQLISQVIDTYGEAGAKTYTELPRITVFGYLAGSDAEKAAKFLGSQDISKPSHTTSSGASGASASSSNQETSRLLVHPAQFASLRPGQAFAKVGGEVYLIQLPFIDLPAVRAKEMLWTHLKGGYKLLDRVFEEARHSHTTVRSVMACVERANASLNEKQRLTVADFGNMLVIKGLSDSVIKTCKTWPAFIEKWGKSPLERLLTARVQATDSLAAFLTEDKDEADEFGLDGDASGFDDDGEEPETDDAREEAAAVDEPAVPAMKPEQEKPKSIREVMAERGRDAT